MRILFAFLLLSFLACQNNSAPSTDTAADAPPSSTLPSIPPELAQQLYDKTTYIDYLFHNLPISMNQSQQNDIRQALGMIGKQPVALQPGCQPIGKVYFDSNGSPLAEADLYFAPNCTYFVWLVDGKPTYANPITNGGIQFFNNVIASTQQPGG